MSKIIYEIVPPEDWISSGVLEFCRKMLPEGNRLAPQNGPAVPCVARNGRGIVGAWWLTRPLYFDHATIEHGSGASTREAIRTFESVMKRGDVYHVLVPDDPVLIAKALDMGFQPRPAARPYGRQIP